MLNGLEWLVGPWSRGSPPPSSSSPASLLFVFNRYKRCPSNRVLVIYGKVGSGNAAKLRARRRGVRLAADPGLRYLSLEPIQIEIPLQGRTCRWKTSASTCRACSPSPSAPSPEVMQNAAIRLLGLEHRRDQQAGRGNHLRPVAAGDRLDADRGHQPRPRKVSGAHSEARSSRN